MRVFAGLLTKKPSYMVRISASQNYLLVFLNSCVAGIIPQVVSRESRKKFTSEMEFPSLSQSTVTSLIVYLQLGMVYGAINFFYRRIAAGQKPSGNWGQPGVSWKIKLT